MYSNTFRGSRPIRVKSHHILIQRDFNCKTSSLLRGVRSHILNLPHSPHDYYLIHCISISLSQAFHSYDMCASCSQETPASPFCPTAVAAYQLIIEIQRLIVFGYCLIAFVFVNRIDVICLHYNLLLSTLRVLA